MKLKETEILYVRTMGKAIRVTAVFDNDEDANKYMEKNRDEGLVAEFGELRLIANLYDKGVRIEDNARRTR